MLAESLSESLYFGFAITLIAYFVGLWVKQKLKLTIFNPILVSTGLIIGFLYASNITYEKYEQGAKHISYLLTPATVCFAIPLYRQLEILKKNMTAIFIAIFSGVITSASTIYILSLILNLEHVHYVTLLPKSITTAIGIGVSEEAGGIVSITMMCILVTGIIGAVIAEIIFKVFKITDPIAKGVALGTSSHAVGTSKAFEIGEVEGAMSSLAIAVAGVITAVIVPFVINFI